ncbi:MAG: mechanosensitive ion channel family protein [Chloroflexi bacterium]|nr:mechanosensitive ion channel family protein [Chloroflexota bacterium]
MPTLDPNDLDGLVAFLRANWFAVAFWGIVLVVGYRLARPLVHRLAVRIMRSASREGDDELRELRAAEAEKRAATVEDLVSKLLRGAIIVIGLLILLALFDLFPVIAGLGIVLAAITLAGQDIVLDYLMGILILVEGQYFIGDWISVGGVEGSVEEITLRRTVIRDATGTVHSVSNGVIRTSSNLTRLYAGLAVDVVVPYDTDIDRATAVVSRVGREMFDDPEWSGRLLDAPRLIRVGPLGDLGVTLKVGGRVRAADRWEAPGEFRRRLLAAFNAEGIEIARRGAIVVGKDAAGGTVAVDPTALDAPPPGTAPDGPDDARPHP